MGGCDLHARRADSAWLPDRLLPDRYREPVFAERLLQPPKPSPSDKQQLRVARIARLGFAAVIFIAAEFVLDSVSFIQLLLIRGLG